MDDFEFQQATKVLWRHAVFFLISRANTTKDRLVCRTTASSIYLTLSKNDARIIWDERFIDFIASALLGIHHFDNEHEIRGRSTTGSSHLIATILYRTGELALNDNYSNYQLSAGALMYNYAYFSESLPLLNTHLDGFRTKDILVEQITKLFEFFIEAHEWAHYKIRTTDKEEYYTGEYAKKLDGTIRLLDGKYDEIKNGKVEASETIRQMFTGLHEVYANRLWFEEFQADTLAIEKMFSNNVIHEFGIGRSEYSFIVAVGILKGITALRFLGLSDLILQSKNTQDFNTRFAAHKRFNDTRIMFAEGYLLLSLLGVEEGNRIQDLTHDHRVMVFKTERRIIEMYEDGYIDMMKTVGHNYQTENKWDDSDLQVQCCKAYGWDQFISKEYL